MLFTWHIPWRFTESQAVPVVDLWSCTPHRASFVSNYVPVWLMRRSPLSWRSNIRFSLSGNLVERFLSWRWIDSYLSWQAVGIQDRRFGLSRCGAAFTTNLWTAVDIQFQCVQGHWSHSQLRPAQWHPLRIRVWVAALDDLRCEQAVPQRRRCVSQQRNAFYFNAVWSKLLTERTLLI